MAIHRGIYWGLLVTAWIVFCFGAAFAALLPWWEHTGLVGVDWAVLLRHRLHWNLPVAESLPMALAQLFALGAIGGLLISVLLRLLNDRADIVEQALRWALLALYPALPLLLVASLLPMAAGLFVDDTSAYGLVLALLAAIYFYFSCRQPAVAASLDGRSWWRPALAPMRTMTVVAGAWALSGLAAAGLHLYEVYRDPSWFADLINWAVALAASTIATIALVFRTGYRQLRETLARASFRSLIRAVLDLELRLALLGIVAGVPVLVSALLAIYVFPQLEHGFGELGQPLPRALYLATGLARGLADGYWVIPAAALLPFVFLAQARLIWLLYGTGSAPGYFNDAEASPQIPPNHCALGTDSAPASR